MTIHQSSLSILLVCSFFLCGCMEKKSDTDKMSQAVSLAKQGDWKSAGESMQEISQKNPDALPPVLLQAIAYEKTGDFDKALDLSRQTAALKPDNFIAQYTFGRLSALVPMRRSEAFSILEKAHSLKNDDCDTLILLCNLGTLLKHPRTIIYLHKLRMNKKYTHSPALYYQYGLYYAARNNGKQAVVFMRQAARRSGIKNPELVLNAARCIDRNNFSAREALNLYRFFVNSPTSKKYPALVKEAKQRIAVLK